MKNWFFCSVLLLLMACGEKKTDLSGNTPLKAADFAAAFPKLKGSLQIADTNMLKLADTLQIGYKAFNQFIPDSAIEAIVGKEKKLTIHPVGMIEKDKENYLITTFTSRKKTRVAVFVTDKKMKFLAGKELLSNMNDDGYSHSVSVNREPTFIISRERISKDNTLQFSRAGWVYNNAGVFMVVINDSNEDTKNMAVINPIDTLPRKNKFSGDYVQDKRNYISLRDGANANSYLFFVHFEKNNGSCTGELKGILRLKTTTTGQFSENGDPCVIDFSFEGNELSLKEQGSCGNHRGIRCFFDDTFRKKKEPKAGKKS